MKQVLFLYNPQSGKGKIEKDSQAIGEMFRQAGYSIVDGPIDFSRNPFNGHETVDLVVVAGGDGTVIGTLSESCFPNFLPDTRQNLFGGYLR